MSKVKKGATYISEMPYSFRLIGAALGVIGLMALVQTGTFAEKGLIKSYPLVAYGTFAVFGGGIGWIADHFITLPETAET